jgi:peptidoglycan/LPS O-acetylase OafA/YrhL
LWFEFRCYLLVGALFLLPVVRRRPALLLAAVFAVCTLDVYFDLLGLAWVGPFATYVPFFFAGALVWALRDRLPTSRSLTAASAGAVLLAGVTGHALLLAPLPLAYGVIHLGYQLPRWARRVGARNDYSYGVYVYAFPVAQMLVAVGVAGAGPWVLALVTLACTMPLAAGSWWLVERRALRAGRRVAERLETRKVPRTGLPGGDRAVRGGEPELATSRA